MDRDALSGHHHPILSLAGGGAIGELRHEFLLRPQVLVLMGLDQFLFDVFRPLAWWARRLGSRPFQLFPGLCRQAFCQGDQVRLGVVAEDELDRVFVPTVQLRRLREVRVSAERDAPEPRTTAKRDRAVIVQIRVLMRRPITRTIDEVQRLVGVAQREYQRVKSPLPVIGPFHASLALSRGGGDGAIRVQNGLLKECFRLLRPDLQTYLVDGFHQSQHARLVEPLTEISGGRRIRGSVGRPGHPGTPHPDVGSRYVPSVCRPPANCRRY